MRLPMPAARIRHSLTVIIGHLNESFFFAEGPSGPKKGLYAFHRFGISFADMTELSGACVAFGA